MRTGKVVTIKRDSFDKGALALDKFGQIVEIIDPENKERENYVSVRGEVPKTVTGLLVKDLHKNHRVCELKELQIFAIEIEETRKIPIIDEGSGEEVIETTPEKVHYPLDNNYFTFAMNYVAGKQVNFTLNENKTARIGDFAENTAKALEILNKLPDAQKLRFIADYHDKAIQ